MRSTKFVSALTAAVLTGSMAAFTASAENNDIKADIGLSNKDLSVQSWARDMNVTEGQNTLTISLPKDTKGNIMTVDNIGLLVVDMEDCFDDVGNVSVDKLMIDDTEVSVDEDKVIFGADDGADNNNYRIELYSIFGDTKDSPAFDVSAYTVKENISITFSFDLSGYDGKARIYSGQVVSKDADGKNTAVNASAVTFSDSKGDIECNLDKDKFSAELTRGTYDVTVAADGYVTRVFKDQKVGKRLPDEIRKAELYKNGDIDGDGMVNVTDIANLAAHIKGIKSISDEYSAKTADVNGDTKLNVTDIAMIAAHIKGIRSLK